MSNATQAREKIEDWDMLPESEPTPSAKGINQTNEDRLTNKEIGRLGYIIAKIKQGQLPFLFAILLLASFSFAQSSTALSLSNQSFCSNFGDGGSCDRGYADNTTFNYTQENRIDLINKAGTIEITGKQLNITDGQADINLTVGNSTFYATVANGTGTPTCIVKKNGVAINTTAPTNTTLTIISIQSSSTSGVYSLNATGTCFFDNILIQSHVPPATNTTDNSGTFTRNQALEVSALTNSTDGEIVADWFNNSVAYYTAPRMVSYFPFDAPYSNATFTQDMAITPIANATVSGATWTASGKINGAYSFGGAAFINTTINTFNNASGYTMAAWVNAGSNPSGAGIMTTGSEAAGRIVMYLAGTGVTCYVGAGAVAAGAVVENEWHHFACTWNGTHGRSYRDGILQNTAAVATVQNGTHTIIGKHLGAGGVLIGVVDEARFYNTALTAAEIGSIYRNVPIGKTLDVSTATSSGVWYSTMTSVLGTATSENVTLGGMLNVTAGAGGSATGNTSGFTTPSNQTINATAGNLYAFSSWNATGNCTVANTSNANTAVEVLDISQCTVQANFASACGTITTSGTYTLKNSVAINGATCFNVTAANVTLDCAGFNITGNNSNLSIAVYSNQANTTVKSCNITSQMTGIYIDKVAGATIRDNNIVLESCIDQYFAPSYCSGIYLDGSAGSITTNNSVDARGQAILINNGSTNTIVENSSFYGGNHPAILIQGSNYTNVTNCSANTHLPLGGGGNGILITSASYFNRVANSNVTSRNSPALYIADSDSNTVLNSHFTENNSANIVGRLLRADFNTIQNNSFTSTAQDTAALIGLDENSNGNTFCLNNLTATSNLYVNDTNGSNFYNCTYEAKNQGNIYANVMNGSILIVGNATSSINGLYIGTSANYTNTTSLGKFSCNFISCADYAPLTTENNFNITVSAETSFTNATAGHSFTATAGFSDNNGATDIITSAISATSGTCTYLSNTTSNTTTKTFIYVCTATTPATATILINATDSNGSTATTASANNTYPNHAPTLSSPTITPTLIHLNDTLNCSIGVFSDIDNDTENVSARAFRWFINGVQVATTQTLAAGSFAANDNVTCQETATENIWGLSVSTNSTTTSNVVSVFYTNYGNTSNVTGFGTAFDYSKNAMTTATGNSNSFGLVILALVFFGFYIIGSKYTQERAITYSLFMTLIMSFLLVSGNFLDPMYLILVLIAFLGAIYFSGRV